MEGYKVRFLQNKAVAAQHLDHIDYKDLVKLSGQGKKKSLEWLVVTGRDEKMPWYLPIIWCIIFGPIICRWRDLRECLPPHRHIEHIAYVATSS